MKFLQRDLHSIRKRAWKHKKALVHMNKAIREMELLFTYYPKYCISIKDADFNDALSLHFQIKRNDLFKPGNHN